MLLRLLEAAIPHTQDMGWLSEVNVTRTGLDPAIRDAARQLHWKMKRSEAE